MTLPCYWFAFHCSLLTATYHLPAPERTDSDLWFGRQRSEEGPFALELAACMADERDSPCLPQRPHKKVGRWWSAREPALAGRPSSRCRPARLP